MLRKRFYPQKRWSVPKKAILSVCIFLLINAPFSQGTEITKHCDLYFSNGVRLEAVPTAETNAQRRKGLSNRKNAGAGMLFVYPEAAPREFWMHNTLIPLTAGFLDANGVIINLAHMKPNTDTLHKSVQPAKTVLELGEGGFKKYGLKKGVRLEMTVCLQKG
ncbi:hypothetical protein MSP8887_02843 [Marinomonas spartinae]|uniref:ACR n=1 Tax=Marinomonas spartinae TaxID=1792290 RepID=A0A1A8TDL9_9GAMM|nr:DUF192 domain-containing protein [Marinomonas spartinae]SBS29856.1 hypothetical protein MSP8886_01620 [Marinomonas spartinae]SBS37209.1 hypothetical protein MSP8887_02843 [Marinomonas spartinae]